MNVDAAVFKDKGCIGIGAVARDHKGRVLGCLARRIKGVMEVHAVEATALKWTLHWAREMCLPGVIFDPDCLEVCKAWEKDNLLTEFDLLTRHVRSLSLLFPMVHICHVSREANKAGMPWPI